jgi:tetratricopeptide (TPR) repeat protein
MLSRRCYYLLIILFASFILSACNSTFTAVKSKPLLLDSAFPNFQSHALETESQIFALDSNMISFVEKSIAGQITEKGKLTQLAHAIFDRTKLSLTYSAGANTTAMETYYGGTANCLSLTILTFSMTQHLGLNSEFQEIGIPEYWTRRGGSTFINRHINLRVNPRTVRRLLLSRAPIIVDFDPQQGMNKFKATEITKSQMVSHFYVNKSADFMIANDPSRAYAYLRAAIKKDPANAGAWLNLGVLFSQHDLYPQAQAYYEMAMSLRPDFTTAYENMALLYARQGNQEKANSLLAKLHKKRVKNPYYHMVLGDIAIESQAYLEAIEHYKDAIALNNRPHEFHFSMAKAYYSLGDVENAHRYLENAKRRANDSEVSEQYTSKISILLAGR